MHTCKKHNKEVPVILESRRKKKKEKQHTPLEGERLLLRLFLWGRGQLHNGRGVCFQSHKTSKGMVGGQPTTKGGDNGAFSLNDEPLNQTARRGGQPTRKGGQEGTLNCYV